MLAVPVVDRRWRHLAPRRLLELEQILCLLTLAPLDLGMEARVTMRLVELEPLRLELPAQRRGCEIVMLLPHEEDVVVLVVAAVHIAHADLLVAKETDRADKLQILGSVLVYAEILRRNDLVLR